MSFEKSLKYQINKKEHELKQKVNSLKNTMEQLLQRLDNGSSVNSLGEVQGQGLEVDRLCSELEQLKDILEEYEMFEKVGN